MKELYICEHDSIEYYLNELIKNEYKYIIKAKDKCLSGWGLSSSNGHIQLIACKTNEEKEIILQDLKNDKLFSYVNWYKITDKKSIYATIKNKSYTIRNDWTRCFKEVK